MHGGVGTAEVKVLLVVGGSDEVGSLFELFFWGVMIEGSNGTHVARIQYRISCCKVFRS